MNLALENRERQPDRLGVSMLPEWCANAVLVGAFSLVHTFISMIHYNRFIIPFITTKYSGNFCLWPWNI